MNSTRNTRLLRKPALREPLFFLKFLPHILFQTRLHH
nr:MAG TPA: hypothetical protein [Caudoviricetes sp.]